MVQTNMFPLSSKNAKQQRAANPAPTGQPSANVNRQVTGARSQSAQPQQTRNNDANVTNRDLTPHPPTRSEAKDDGRVRLFGRIGRYFDYRQTQSGKSLATFSLATHQSYRDESGSSGKKTVWQRVVAWGETAEVLSELLQKGARVSVEGKFKTREWTDRENNLRTTTELVARNVRFLDLAEA